MHLSSLFYTRRFRKLIAELKQKGVFREEPLYELDKLAYWAAMPLYIWPLLIWYDGRVSLHPLLLFAFILVPVWIRETRYWINRVIIPCTVGTLEPIVVDEKTISTVFPFSAWVFYYHFEEDERSRRFLGMWVPKEYRSPLIPQKLFDKEKFIAESKMAFVVSKDFNNNCPYIEGLVQKYRMTTVSISNEG